MVLLLSGSARMLHAQVSDFSFRIGQSRLDSSYKYNSRAISDLAANINGSNGQVSIYAYSSPDGSTARNRQLAKQRASSIKTLLESQNAGLTFNIYIIDEDWDGVASYLKHSKEEWAKEALEIVNNSDKSKRKQLLQELWVGEAWDHLMRNCFPALRRVCARFSPPVSVEQANSSALVTLGFNNSSSVPKIDSQTASLIKDIISSNPASVTITAYASPEGTESYNQKLSVRRALRVMDILVSYGCKADIKMNYGGMDWTGLSKEVKKSASVPERLQVLDILNGGYDSATTKKKLQSVAYGRAWLHMMEYEMAPLRRVEISFN